MDTINNPNPPHHPTNFPLIKGVYKHYKGGTYVVLTMARHTETRDTLVIYQSIEFGSIHARPLNEWNKMAIVKRMEEGNEIQDEVIRFTYLFNHTI